MIRFPFQNFKTKFLLPRQLSFKGGTAVRVRDTQQTNKSMIVLPLSDSPRGNELRNNPTLALSVVRLTKQQQNHF